MRRGHRIAAVTLAAAALAAAAGGAARAARPKLIVLGIDGASADRVEKLMGENRLPNLAALAERGGYTPLRSANPAQSPVSWATIVTGTNPGKTGIYDFLRRVLTIPATNVSIDIGLAEVEKREPLPAWGRAGLVAGAGAAGAAAGVGVILALYAGRRREKRPKGLLQGTMTGTGALFACAAYVVLQWVPATVPFAKNLRSGEPFWVTLDKDGVRCVALEAPLAFPADHLDHGCCLSGLGVPDAAGTWGTFALWTDDPTQEADTETGGVAYFVEPGAPKFDVVLVGPRNPLSDPKTVAAAMQDAQVEKYAREAAGAWQLIRRRQSETKERILRLADKLTTRVGVALAPGRGVELTTAEGRTVALAPGVWSDLVPVEFRMSPLTTIHARVRFLLQSVRTGPPPRGDGPFTPLRLFVAPVQFDAANLPPNVEIATPRGFGAELVRANGQFETVGWPELTNPVKDDMLADREFVAHLDIVRANREKRLFERMARDDWDVLFAMFAEPDRAQHALYRHVDAKSPTHDPEAAREFGGEIDRAYTEMDRMVGEVMAKAPRDAHVVVVSDHGFAPFRRGVNLNNFLCSKGLQIRSGNAGPAGLAELQGGKFFTDVRWNETAAYAIGLGNVYLNLAGRESQGCVQPTEADEVLAEIEQGLMALRDADGAKVVRRVYRGRDIFHGPRAAEAPDLVVGFEWGYRVSWQNCLGALDDDVIVDNEERWSGDHCSVDPELVPGIFFSSLAFAPGVKPGVEDVAPSILSLYGLASRDADGRPVFAK